MTDARRGMTLIEVLIASVILTLGMLGILQLFAKSQRLMLASTRFEIGQRVFVYGEMLHPLPKASEVADDPIDNEKLNIEPEDASEIIRDLELELPESDEKKFETYTFERHVDDIDDDELERNGGIYVVRTIVKWGGGNWGGEKEKEEIVRLWRKEDAGGGASK